MYVHSYVCTSDRVDDQVYVVYIDVTNISLYVVLQSCTITSPSANTIRISCELLERISVTISSNSCTCSQPIIMVGNNPITVSDLPIGVYTVEVTADDMNVENNRIVKMITVYDKSTAIDESGIFSHAVTICDWICENRP